jgi:hypothetical protein
MPLVFGGNTVALVGTCGADEALELVDLLAKPERPTVDLSACTNLHSALVQTLLAFGPGVCAEPVDPFLARWISPLLAASRAAGTEHRQ